MTGGPCATWSLQSPSGSGAIALIQIEGDIDEAFRRLSIAPVNVGDARLRSLAGVDTGVVARWSDSCAHLMPHAGPAVVRALIDAFAHANIARASRPDAWPEAADEIEAHMLAALARAASPLAIDLLLDQPRRWRKRALAPDATHSAILRRLIDPPLVVAIGETNIGKSTLVNTLAGRCVAVVADEPATTRDPVGVTLDLQGLVVRYLDTPGRLAAPTGIDREAARIAAELAKRADLLLLCGDHAAHPPPPPPGFDGRTLTVALRSDLGHTPFEHDASVSIHELASVNALGARVREALVPADALADDRPWRFWDEPQRA